MHCYKNARTKLPTDRSLTILRALRAKRPRAICTLAPPPPTQSNAPYPQRVWMTGGLCHPAKHHSDLFQRADRFAITARESELGGHWRRACRKATSLWGSRRVAASVAYSSWSARYLPAPDILRSCEQAGRADFTHSGRIVIGPIACIGTLTASCISSGMSSSSAGPLHCMLPAHRNCAASGRSCPGTVLTRIYPAPVRGEFRCEETAGAPDRRDLRRANQTRLQSVDPWVGPAKRRITSALTKPHRKASVLG